MQDEFIFGVQGWKTRSHDASAAITHCHGGKADIIAAAEEERFTGSKHAYDTLPASAIRFCLQQAGIKAEELSAIAIPFQYERMYGDRGIQFRYSSQQMVSMFLPQLSIPHNIGL